jgi:hypothetical protein
VKSTVWNKRPLVARGFPPEAVCLLTVLFIPVVMQSNRLAYSWGTLNLVLSRSFSLLSPTGSGLVFTHRGFVSRQLLPNRDIV